MDRTITGNKEKGNNKGIRAVAKTYNTETVKMDETKQKYEEEINRRLHNLEPATKMDDIWD